MLRHDISDRVWFFDLEWVPDAEGAKRLYGLGSDVSELDAFEVLWKKGGATEDVQRPFLKYYVSRIVSIAFLQRRVVYSGPDKQISFSLHALPRDPHEAAATDERHVLEEFLHYLGKMKPQLVGFNSSESDVQVLIQRAMINEVSAPEFCARPANRWDTNDYFQRWDNEWHLDLLKKFSNGKMAPKLDDFAKLCGFPGKLDTDGAQVPDLWLSGDLVKIVEYNQIDTLNTYLLWLRFVYFCGKIGEEEYAEDIEAFRNFLETESQKPCKAFLSEFIDRWPA